MNKFGLVCFAGMKKQGWFLRRQVQDRWPFFSGDAGWDWWNYSTLDLMCWYVFSRKFEFCWRMLKEIPCRYMGVSENGGTPKSSIWIRISILNRPFSTEPTETTCTSVCHTVLAPSDQVLERWWRLLPGNLWMPSILGLEPSQKKTQTPFKTRVMSHESFGFQV